MRYCEQITTPAGNTARLQLSKPWHQLTHEQRLEHFEIIDAFSAELDALPDKSCHACGSPSSFPHCYPARRNRGEKCCDRCDHTPRPKS